ncbi:MAG: DEAD/DEAH box helicase [Dermatophilaceae bacterium]
MTEIVREFAAGLGFDLDDFQIAGCEAVAAGRGVLVAAPTGAGKTVVGEFAVHAALASGRKAFYTTPIKALSNQKYADLVRRHGADRVGLLTGDASVNGEAPVVVMTTEVLRNMLYAGSATLAGLGYVVMDEVHYLADRSRGAVWEEVIVHLPPEVLVVSLSATVSNAEEFGQWLGEVRGAVQVVVDEHRPVPLWQHMLVGRTLYDLFVVDDPAKPGEVNPQLLARVRALEGTAYRDGPAYRDGSGRRRGGHGGRAEGGGARRASRAEVVARLDHDGLLPAICFVFSRVGCDAAVGQLLGSGLRLVDDEQARRNREYVEQRVAGLADEDLGVLGYWDLVDGLSRGFAAHHAGMLPTFREIVEELFTAGRVKVVFATETLALGINMPARTVVLDRLVKFNGQTHAEVTPAEYTQLTGRAGRRGIDVEGHAVVLWSRGVQPEAVGGLASTRTYPLRSSFRPTSNMAVNLVARLGRERAREVLQSSFAQFQADRAVVGLSRAVRRGEHELVDLSGQMRCHLGEFAECAALREQLRELEKGATKARTARARADAAAALQALRVGEVIRVPAGRHGGYAVVVAAARGGPERSSGPSVVTEDRRLRRLTALDMPTPVEVLTTVRVPKAFNPRNAKARRDLATTLRIAVSERVPQAARPGRAARHTEPVDDERVARLRRELRAHPCHACPDREAHARVAERWWRKRRDVDALARQVQGRTGSVARSFDRICALLAELGYLDPPGQSVTAAGAVLRGLYTERDLLAAECLRRGVWSGLDPPGLAAVVSALVHEPRRDEGDTVPAMPSATVREVLERMTDVAAELAERERAHEVVPSTPPDAGIARMVHRWAGGARLHAVLRDSDIAAGDFVRRCKQVADLLGQIADVSAGTPVAATARRAADGVLRGVVAADRLD